MRSARLLAAFVFVLLVPALVFAQSATQTQKAPAAQAKAGRGASALGSPADESAVRALADQYQQAFNAGDAAKAAGVYAEHAVFVDEMGKVVEGRAAIEKGLASGNAAERPRLTLVVEAVRFIKPDVALMRGSSTAQGGNVPQGQGAGHWAVVAMKVGGQWKVVAAQAAVNPPATGRGGQ